MCWLFIVIYSKQNPSFLPECNADEFKCEIGGGCISLKEVCNGEANCGDRSDEWNCLSLQKESSALEAHLENETSLICSDNWNSGYSDMACNLMGYTGSIQYEEIDKPANIAKMLRLKNDVIPGTPLLSQLESGVCNKVVSLTCQKHGKYKGIITKDNISVPTYQLLIFFSYFQRIV